MCEDSLRLTDNARALYLEDFNVQFDFALQFPARTWKRGACGFIFRTELPELSEFFGWEWDSEQLAKAFRMGANHADEPFHFQIKAHTQIRSDLRVITDGPGKLGVRLRMDRVPHNPAILRMRARDS